MSYEIIFTKQGIKDYEKIKKSQYSKKVKSLLLIIENDPINNDKTEQLNGDLKGFFSIRINRQHRIVYFFHEESKTIEIFSMWTHYDNMPK